MGKSNKVSKRQLAKLVKTKISVGISEVDYEAEKTASVQKAISKASKLISAKLRKSLKNGTENLVLAKGQDPVPTPKKNGAKKAEKKTRDVKGKTNSVKIAKKAAKKNNDNNPGVPVSTAKENGTGKAIRKTKTVKSVAKSAKITKKAARKAGAVTNTKVNSEELIPQS